MKNKAISIITFCLIICPLPTGCSSSTTSSQSENNPPATNNQQPTNPSNPPDKQENIPPQDPEIALPESSTNNEEISVVSIWLGIEMLGTGVAIYKNKESIYILTAAHVLKRPGVGDPLTIKNRQNQAIETISDKTYDLQVTSGLVSSKKGDTKTSQDLALIKINASQSGKIITAKLGTIEEKDRDKDEDKDKIRIFGYRGCINNSSDTDVAKWQISNGNIQIFNPKGIRNIKDIRKTTIYDLTYTNNTVKGMSGSPIIDTKNKIVGIHASASIFDHESNKKYDKEKCESLPPEPSAAYTNNMGTSSEKIKEFLKTALPEYPSSP